MPSFLIENPPGEQESKMLPDQIKSLLDHSFNWAKEEQKVNKNGSNFFMYLKYQLIYSEHSEDVKIHVSKA